MENLQNEQYYRVDEINNTLISLGEISGEFQYVCEFTKYGFDCILLSDNKSVYLIVK